MCGSGVINGCRVYGYQIAPYNNFLAEFIALALSSFVELSIASSSVGLCIAIIN